MPNPASLDELVEVAMRLPGIKARRVWSSDVRAILAAILPLVLKDAREALGGITERYVSLAGSGDCGFWNPEEEPEVIAARSTLSHLESLLKDRG